MTWYKRPEKETRCANSSALVSECRVFLMVAYDCGGSAGVTQVALSHWSDGADGARRLSFGGRDAIVRLRRRLKVVEPQGRGLSPGQGLRD